MALGTNAGMTERSGHVAVIFKNQDNKSQIFVFGGFNGDEVLGDVWFFDIESQEWREVLGIPRVGDGLEEE